MRKPTAANFLGLQTAQLKLISIVTEEGYKDLLNKILKNEKLDLEGWHFC